MKPDLVLKIASTSEVAKTQAATYVGELCPYCGRCAPQACTSRDQPNKHHPTSCVAQHDPIQVNS